ncbi:hypothetical protein ABZ618_27120 [Streptomyces roseolus]|uniref:hypothetical protein n=1 Tax=Streptomyces roseolus TaxID=67358 RepID=UPI0033FBD65E
MDEHAKLLVTAGDLGREPVHQELRRSTELSDTRSAPSGWKTQCHLPEWGWGLLDLSGGVVITGKDWTDDCNVHEVHSLKRRAATAARTVPIPPQFVRVLASHIERFGVAQDGRLFRNGKGNYVDAAAYGVPWARAREYGLTRLERAPVLAKRPYDLQYAGISFRLYSGVDPAECARRAGQSIQVLFRFYAKFLDGVRRWTERGPEIDRNSWSGAGCEWDEPGASTRVGYCDG